MFIEHVLYFSGSRGTIPVSRRCLYLHKSLGREGAVLPGCSCVYTRQCHCVKSAEQRCLECGWLKLLSLSTSWHFSLSRSGAITAAKALLGFATRTPAHSPASGSVPCYLLSGDSEDSQLHSEPGSTGDAWASWNGSQMRGS